MSSKFPSAIAQWRGRLRPMLTGGTAVVLGTVVATNLLRIVSSVTLTRLLDVEAFGVVGIITSMTIVLGMISDIGVIPFVIRHERGDDPHLLDEIWTARLIRGCALSLLMVALSQPLAIYSGKPELQLVLAVFGVTFAIEGLSSMVFATALREHRVKKLSLLDLIIGVFQVVVSIILAAAIRSYWSIVAAALLGQALKTLLSYTMFSGSGRRLRFNRERTLELWRFSRFIVTSSMLGVLIGQADKLLFARIFSLQMFGVYSIASTLALVPIAIVAAYTERMLYPSYAATFRTAPDQLRHVYYDRKRLVSLAYIFGVGGLIGSAPLVVAILYDPRYAGVAPLLSILAISPLLAFNNWAADRVLIATGRAWATVVTNFLRVGWLAIGAVIAIATGNQMLLVVAVGTAEVPASLFHWAVQWKFQLLSLKEELGALVVGATGAAIGAAGSAAILELVKL